jgi:hypothetical protein
MDMLHIDRICSSCRGTHKIIDYKEDRTLNRLLSHWGSGGLWNLIAYGAHTVNMAYIILL